MHWTRIHTFVLTLLTLLSFQTNAFSLERSAAEEVSFSKDIYPILRDHCIGCHQPAKAGGGYLLTDYQGLIATGDSNEEPILKGESTKSHLIQLLQPVDGKAEMPKGKKPLSDHEIELIARWIDQGAKNDHSDSVATYSTKNPPKYVRPPNINSLKFSRDNREIVVVGFHEALVFDSENWTLKNRLIGLSPRLESIAYSPDGKWIAIGAGEPGIRGELQIWNRETSELHASYTIANDTLFGLNWSPDSRLISFACSDNSIRAVDLAGEQKFFSRVHEDWARATGFTVDGRHLLSVSRDMTVKLTEVETERFIDNVTSITPGALRGGMQALALHPLRNEMVVGGADGTPSVYRIFRQTARVIGDDANLLRKLDTLPGRIFDVAISPDAKYIAAVSTLDNNSLVRVWDYDVESQIPDEIKAIQSKPAEQRTAEEKTKLETHVPPQPTAIASWEVPNVALYSIAIDGKGRVATGGADGKLRVWNIADQQSLFAGDVTPAESTANLEDSQLAQLRSSRRDQLAAAHLIDRDESLASLAKRNVNLDEIVSIEVEPATIHLDRWNDSVQLLVTGTLSNGSRQDVTQIAEYNASDSKGIWVSARGWGTPVANDTGSLRVQLAGKEVVVPVKIEMLDNRETDFIRDINPVLSRLGCNQGTCHGAQAGKNGFKLSLRGYDPIFDIRSLADDLAGRRLNPASPMDSLILSKPLGLVPHVGGTLFKEGDVHAEVLRQWIAEGAKLDLSSSKVESIAITPTNPILAAEDEIQQFRVVAKYVNGEVRDVTREAFVETGNGEVAAVIDGARVRSIRRGEAPILARFEGAYAATTLTVMGDRNGFEWTPNNGSVNEIDRIVAQKWSRMKIEPSDLCSDSEFLRRVSIDLTGLPPSVGQVREFLNDPTPSAEKRAATIDRLIGSEAFIEHWTNKWSDLLQVNSKFLGKEGASGFKEWIRSSIAANKPYDQFVREIVSAKGSNRENPPAAYYKILRDPESTVENTTHLFLGVRFNCNKCHDHPFEKWTQDQYFQMAAYFSQVSLSKDDNSGDRTIGGSAVEGAKPLYEIVADSGNTDVKHPRTMQTIGPKFPFDCQFEQTEGATRRDEFAAWLTHPSNPYFAKSYVNRVWGYLLGKGLIEPIDDIRAGNPASIPELLEHLEHRFVASHFDVQSLMKEICKSKTYQLSIQSNQWNKDDDRNYSHALPRRLSAEVLYDAIHLVTGSKSNFPGLDPGVRAASLADADAGLPDGFLNNLGRPPRESACECERSSELRLGAVMALVSGPTLGTAISDTNNSIRQMVGEIESNEELVDELFMRVLNRPATPLEVEATASLLGDIRTDHENLVKSLADKEAWWIEERVLRQAQREQEKADSIKELSERQEAIKADREAAEAKRLEKASLTRSEIEKFEGMLAAKANEFVDARKNNVVWATLAKDTAKATNGGKLKALADRSIVGEKVEEKGVFYVDTLTPAFSFNAIRLEVLTFGTAEVLGPGVSGNGNFVLTEIEVFAGDPAKPESLRKLKLVKGLTDFDQPGFSAAAAIDDKLNDQGGWAIHGATQSEHWAVFQLDEPVELQPGEVLQWRLHQFHDADKHRIGRFRLSVGKVDGELGLGLPESLAAIGKLPVEERTEDILKAGVDYLARSSAELNGLRNRYQLENQPLPEDEIVVALKKRLERLEAAIPDDAQLTRLRNDVKESEKQLSHLRVTAAEDITWALINSPAFLFNH